MLTEIDQPDWESSYTAVRPTYERFADRLAGFLGKTLTEYDVPFELVSWRAKEISSFVEKCGRKGPNYESPLEDMTDLARHIQT